MHTLTEEVPSWNVISDKLLVKGYKGFNFEKDFPSVFR